MLGRSHFTFGINSNGVPYLTSWPYRSSTFTPFPCNQRTKMSIVRCSHRCYHLIVTRLLQYIPNLMTSNGDFFLLSNWLNSYKPCIVNWVYLNVWSSSLDVFPSFLMENSKIDMVSSQSHPIHFIWLHRLTAS